MAQLSDADQGGLSLPRFDPRRADRSRPGDLPGPGPARRLPRHSGMAQLLFQVANDQCRALSRARPFHPVHETEEHLALDDGRRPDHPPRPGILRLKPARNREWLAPPIPDKYESVEGLQPIRRRRALLAFA